MTSDFVFCRMIMEKDVDNKSIAAGRPLSKRRPAFLVMNISKTAANLSRMLLIKGGG